MVNLNETQERLLASIITVREQTAPDLDKLRDAYELASYRAAAPVRDAILAAQAGGVPFSRISKEGMGFSYPAKLKDWLRPPGALVEEAPARTVRAPETEAFEDVVESVNTVTRNSGTGLITAHYLGKTYEIDSLGPPDEFWSTASPDVPQGVYELIKEKFPNFELMEEDDED